MKNLFSKITGEFLGPVTIYIENKLAIDLAKNPVFHARSKHIDIRYHFIRECIEKGEIEVKHICSEKQHAYVLTKSFASFKFEKMRNLLGVKNLS